jgi:disease resistance protein RPM1
MFPEEYSIEKSSVVWMWIAEGFVQERKGMSSFEIGEGYFNQLVNRSLIQLVETDHNRYGTVCGCQVHDMILDLIRSIAFEDNFLTILDKNEGASSSSQGKIRRLALQDNRAMKARVDMQVVSSFISWWWDISKGISLSSFKLLRVLALRTNSYSYYSNNRRHVQLTLRNLLRLRYLKLRVDAALCSQQTKGFAVLDEEKYGINEEVTPRLGHVTKLLCLRIKGRINTLPDGIGELTSLEEMDIYYGGEEEEAQMRFVKELCGLRELTVLCVDIPFPLTAEVMGEVEDDDVVQQLLRNLQKLEILSLRTSTSFPIYADTRVCEATGFFLPQHLRVLSLIWISFSRFPSLCINPSRLPNLSHLSLRLHAMDEQDLRILGWLPQLSSLDLFADEVVCNITRTTADDACLSVFLVQGGPVAASKPGGLR